MAVNRTDLFVLQSQSDSKLYKLRFESLLAEIQGDAGVNFRGAADLNNPPASSISVLSPDPGDLYMVESDATSIDSGWVMKNGETTADEGDRIIYDGDNSYWIIVTTGTKNVGTVIEVQARLPLQSDGDIVTPIISALEARTNTEAGTSGDGNGTDGVVHRLAEVSDVDGTSGTADPRAVVTADLLKATNEIVDDLVSNPAGVLTLTTRDDDANSALLISSADGDVDVELTTASDSKYGVTQIADASAVLNGTSGPSAVVDASMLKNVADAIPTDIVASLTEGGTDIIVGALQITADADDNVTIGVNKDTFAPYNFSALTDITE